VICEGPSSSMVLTGLLYIRTRVQILPSPLVRYLMGYELAIGVVNFVAIKHKSLAPYALGGRGGGGGGGGGG
jgi:hypothetical protein